MKKIGLYIALAGLIISSGCSKDDPPPPPTTLSFKANGELVTRNGAAPMGSSQMGSTITKTTSTDPAYPPYYTLFSKTDPDVYAPQLSLRIMSGNLVAGTYTLATTVTIYSFLAPHRCFMPNIQ